MRASDTPSLAARARSSAYVALHAPLQAQFPFRSPAAIERAKLRRLRWIVEHAWRHVPYYTETMKRLGLTPAEIQTTADLAKLPILEPDQLRVDPEYFVSRKGLRGGFLEHQTSGSTGEPRTYFRDQRSLVAAATHFSRVMTIAAHAAGKRFGLIQASILPPVSSALNAQRAYRAGSLVKLSVRNTQLSLLDPPEVNIAHLNELKPDIIFTFGSYVEALFAHLGRTEQPFHRPGAIIYSADPLSDPIRKEVIEKHCIQLLSTYQAAEMPLIAFECERHDGLHSNGDLYPLRIVGPDGEEIGAGEDGEVIVSNLVNRGTVLLNYRIGDLARCLPQECSCGRNLPLISLAEGRSEDWLTMESGSLIHPQAISMWVYRIPGIWRYQAVQEEPARFRMNVVAAPGSDQSTIRESLERELKGVLGEGVTLQVTFSDSLPRTSAGKIRPVISKVRPGRSGPP